MSKAFLIIIIVQKGWADIVVETAMKAGAGGSTTLFGRGSGIHEKQKLLGISIVPEKEIVLILVNEQLRSSILQAIIDAVDLNKPGMGIAFVIPVESFAGVSHLIQPLNL